MGKYHLIWSLNQNLIPADPKERASGWGMLMEMAKQDLSKGIAKDWGSFPGENKGYCILEGTTLDVMKMTQQYAPYVKFEVHPVASVNEIGELLKHMSG
jgi:hypothetical protein